MEHTSPSISSCMTATEEMDIIGSEEISLADCIQVAHWIQQENSEHGKHMLEKHPQELYKQVTTNGWCAIKIGNELIWFICIMAVHQGGITLFEPGSLFVQKAYRHQWLWQKMKEELLKKHPHLPMYSVTNVEAVKKINKYLHQYEYTKQTIQHNILEIIELPGKLLEDDVIYCNDILHALLQRDDTLLPPL